MIVILEKGRYMTVSICSQLFIFHYYKKYSLLRFKISREYFEEMFLGDVSR